MWAAFCVKAYDPLMSKYKNNKEKGASSFRRKMRRLFDALILALICS